MIDKKKIKEAADEYCAPLFSETTPRPHRQSWSGDTIIFKAGINWFLENLWHDASEEPKIYKGLLVEYQDKSVILLTVEKVLGTMLSTEKLKSVGSTSRT